MGGRGYLCSKCQTGDCTEVSLSESIFFSVTGNSAGGTFQGFNKPQPQPQQFQQQQVYNNNNNNIQQQQQPTPIKKVDRLMCYNIKVFLLIYSRVDK